MKILHVVAGMDPKLGGVCQAVRTMITGLEEMGAGNEVVSLDAPDAPFLSTDSFKTHALGPGQGPWNYSSKLVPWLLENVSRFDCVIAHGLWLYHTYAVRKALRLSSATATSSAQSNKLKPKLYVMPHGMLDPYFQRAADRKLKAARNWIYWKLIEAQVINEADGLLFTCEDERRLAREPFKPYHPKRELVVGLGVEEPPTFAPSMREALLAKCPELRDSPFILYLSRLHEKKGVDLLLKAYAALAAKTKQSQPVLAAVNGGTSSTSVSVVAEPHALPKLVIAGPGLETAYGQQLQRIVSESGDLEAAVFFPGMLAGEVKWGAFYSCEAFVLPSHQENFGIAVVEAMACSKPVLISNQVNIWREIEAGGGGLVADDTLAGASKLLEAWLSQSEEKKSLMGEHARKTFVEKFAVQSAASRLLAALKE